MASVIDCAEYIKAIFNVGNQVSDVIDEVLSSVVPPEKIQEYVDDQDTFHKGLRDAVEIRLRRSAVGGAQWQRLGAVGIAVQVIHKAQRLAHQVQPANEVLQVPVDDPKQLEEIKNNAIDVAVYGLMLVGKIIEMQGGKESG
jgi:predicted flavoprotein YhiN